MCVGGGRADVVTPPQGFAVQCWYQVERGGAITPVELAPGATVTGIDFHLVPNPA